MENLPRQCIQMPVHGLFNRGRVLTSFRKRSAGTRTATPGIWIMFRPIAPCFSRSSAAPTTPSHPTVAISIRASPLELTNSDTIHVNGK